MELTKEYDIIINNWLAEIKRFLPDRMFDINIEKSYDKITNELCLTLNIHTMKPKSTDESGIDIGVNSKSDYSLASVVRINIKEVDVLRSIKDFITRELDNCLSVIIYDSFNYELERASSIFVDRLMSGEDI